MRYIKRLERKDLALNFSMISLGSCTMKLNAAVEMLPLSWPNWGNIHPFAPLESSRRLPHHTDKLEAQLTEITGFAGTSSTTKLGSARRICGISWSLELIMNLEAITTGKFASSHRSAHGTNPASAVMAGMKVVVTKSSENGNIDVEDLREKATLP